jgi:hypothetical protein
MRKVGLPWWLRCTSAGGIVTFACGRSNGSEKQALPSADGLAVMAIGLDVRLGSGFWAVMVMVKW